MFQIVLRLVGTGAPSDVLREPLPTIDETHQLHCTVDGHWSPVEKNDVGEIYHSLEHALKDFKEVTNGVFTKDDKLQRVVDKIGEFHALYRRYGVTHRAFFEIQVLNPVNIKTDEVDLEVF